MITADLDAALAGIGTTGTWRPGPPGQDAAPGTYVTPVAFRLAARVGGVSVGPADSARAHAGPRARVGGVRVSGVSVGPLDNACIGGVGSGPADSARVGGVGRAPADSVRAHAGPRARIGGVSGGPVDSARADAGAGDGPRAPAASSDPRARAGPGGDSRATGDGIAEARPAHIAEELAARLRRLEWVAAVTVTGGGYLTVTVTAETLAALAVRVTQAGPACVRSAALAGTSLTAPREPDLASAPTWDEARRRLAAAISGKLAQAAGADVLFQEDSKRMAPAAPATSAGQGPVADAIAFAGVDAVTFALARVPAGRQASVDAASVATHRLGNPAYAVRYAHAHAAAALRQAADLGLGLGDAAEFWPQSLAHPSERSLLYELSWLPERVAGAARRGQPDVLARYLETLAVAYLDCQRCCPATWPGMLTPGSPGNAPWAVERRSGGPASCEPSASCGRPGSEPSGGGPPGEQPRRWAGEQAGRAACAVITGRLWLTAAARTALRAGLDLLGVSAPDRL